MNRGKVSGEKARARRQGTAALNKFNANERISSVSFEQMNDRAREKEKKKHHTRIQPNKQKATHE